MYAPNCLAKSWPHTELQAQSQFPSQSPVPFCALSIKSGNYTNMLPERLAKWPAQWLLKVRCPPPRKNFVRVTYGVLHKLATKLKINTTTSLKSQSKTAKRSLAHSICHLFIGFCCYLRTLQTPRTPHANYILCTKLVSACGPKRAASNMKCPKTQPNRVRNGYAGNSVCHASLNSFQHTSGKVDMCIGN